MSLYSVSGSRQTDSHPGYRRMFHPGHLTLGVFFPIEAFSGDQPTMEGQDQLAQCAEQLGFAALWFRDVPLRVPDFGDVGQVYDLWVYLGYMAAMTRKIALATGAIVLPLRHPLHTAKAAASIDRLSGGRLVLGVASGDRPIEFPAFGLRHEERGEIFREHLEVLRTVLTTEYPRISGRFGDMDHADMVPKPIGGMPTLVTGQSQQSLQWIAENADGWITYPRLLEAQIRVLDSWKAHVAEHGGGVFKPFAQSLYIDLAEDPGEMPRPIHLGYRLGRLPLIELLQTLQHAGANHVALNLKYGARTAADVLVELGEYVVPLFSAGTKPEQIGGLSPCREATRPGFRGTPTHPT